MSSIHWSTSNWTSRRAWRDGEQITEHCDPNGTVIDTTEGWADVDRGDLAIHVTHLTDPNSWIDCDLCGWRAP